MSTHPPTKSVLRWPGGKRRLLKHLLPLVPKDAVCYCEVFAGSAALLLAKERHSNRKLFSDCRVQPVVTRNLRANKRTHAEATFGELIIQPA